MRSRSSRQFDARRWLAFCNQNKIRALMRPSVDVIARFGLRLRYSMIILN